MKILEKKWILVLLWILAFAGLKGQVMWPGDVNNNGIVNGVDLLWLGVAYNADGPERPGATTLWTPQPIGMPWVQSFPGGLNYAYADADGDGEVDDNDLDDAIVPNFRLTHGVLAPDGYQNALPGGQAPVITLVPSATFLQPGQVLEVDVRLGTPENPVTNFYGIALQLSYTRELVNNNGDDILFDEDESWIAPGADPPLEHLYYKEPPTGQSEIALVRNDQQPINGHGSIGSFTIIIEDIIVGMVNDSFVLRIDSVMLVDQNNTVYGVVPDTVVVTVDVPISAGEPGRSDLALRVRPNPARAGTPLRVSSSFAAERFELSDALGRRTPLSAIRHSATDWELIGTVGLPPGVYWLTAYGPTSLLQVPLILKE